MYQNRIKELREDADMTQTDLGKLLNVNQKTVSQYERMERDIPTETLIHIAKIFHKSTDYVLGL